MGQRVPTVVLEARGGFEHRPSRKEARAKEPKPTQPIGRPPKTFTKTQKLVWKEIIKQCHPGVLCLADTIWLEMTVRLVCQLREGSISNQGMMQLQSCLSKLGMNPADRSRVQTVLEQIEPVADEVKPWQLLKSHPA